MLFHQMSKFLQLLAEKLMKTPKRASFLEKLLVVLCEEVFREKSEKLAFVGKKRKVVDLVKR